MQDKQHRTGNPTILRAIAVVACIVLMILVCAAVYAVSVTQFTIGYLERPEATVDYIRTLPSTANIIEGKADVADLFGDYSMCAAFTLPEPDLQALRQQGFDWFPEIKGTRTHNSNWVVGLLTEEQIQAVSWMLGQVRDSL